MNALAEPLLFKRGDRELVSFATRPSKYRQWKPNVEGDVAHLKLDIDEDGGIQPGYKRKLNSYDLGAARCAEPHPRACIALSRCAHRDGGFSALRLSAWQNWIFIRPNAVGEEGALKLFGTGKKVKFDWKRI